MTDAIGPDYTFQEQRGILMRDLLAKFQRGDWRGVSEAANELRELDARETAIEETIRMHLKPPI